MSNVKGVIQMSKGWNKCQRGGTNVKCQRGGTNGKRVVQMSNVKGVIQMSKGWYKCQM